MTNQTPHDKQLERAAEKRMMVNVFVQNEAGSTQKNYHDVFSHVSGKEISVGRFLGGEHARAHIVGGKVSEGLLFALGGTETESSS